MDLLSVGVLGRPADFCVPAIHGQPQCSIFVVLLVVFVAQGSGAPST